MLEPLQEKNPIREVRIDQKIQVGKLAKKGSMPNPCHRHLTGYKRGKFRAAMSTRPRREPSLPDHFHEERARVEMVARSQLLERLRYFFPSRRGLPATVFRAHFVLRNSHNAGCALLNKLSSKP